jgi:uncharacterized protein (TIGR02996 family)
VNEEAGFIAALFADPADRTTLLVYADWLDDRGDPRAEFLRILVAPVPKPGRLAELQLVLDIGWMQLISSRHIGAGSRTQYKAPASTDDVLDRTTVTAERKGVRIELTIYKRAHTPSFGWWELTVSARDQSAGT